MLTQYYRVHYVLMRTVMLDPSWAGAAVGLGIVVLWADNLGEFAFTRFKACEV